MPQGLVAGDDDGGPVAEEVKTDRYVDLAAHGKSEKMRDAGRWLIKSKEELVRMPGFARPFDQPGERRRAGWRVPPLAQSRTHESERTGQHVPRLGGGLGGNAPELNARAVLATEVREIQLEDAEVVRPAGFDALKLIVPIVGAREQAVDHRHDAGAPGARLDDPLRGHPRSVRTQLPLSGEPARRSVSWQISSSRRDKNPSSVVPTRVVHSLYAYLPDVHNPRSTRHCGAFGQS